MRALLERSMLLLLMTILCCYSVLPALTRDEVRSTLMPSPATSRLNPPTSLTGKERLGRKWMDEQRINNCNVPIDKRGSTPRPSTCHPTRPDRPG